MKTRLNTLPTALVLLLLANFGRPPIATAAVVIVDFEEKTLFSNPPANTFYNGDDGTVAVGQRNTSGWSSNGVFFENTFDNEATFTDFKFWTGWSYSNVQDNTTPGFFNQYAAYSEGGTAAGHGAGNSRNYAVAFTDSSLENGTLLNLPITATSVTSVDIANTAYAFQFFRNGLDGFETGGVDFSALDQFGDGDFLRLTITGFAQPNGVGSITGSVDVDLANYGGPGSGDDQFLTDWSTVSLTGLGAARSLQFSLASSQTVTIDNTTYITTPTYFALDNLTFQAVPEPSTGWAVFGVAFAIAVRRRARRSVGRPASGPLE